MHSKHSIEKNEFEECTDSAATTVVEQTSENSSPSLRSLGYFVENFYAKNLDEISSWQQSRLIYLADFFPSLLESIKSTKEQCNEPESSISQIYEPVGEWRWRHTKWQAAAQIFWLEKGANVEKKVAISLWPLPILPCNGSYKRGGNQSFFNRLGKI